MNHSYKEEISKGNSKKYFLWQIVVLTLVSFWIILSNLLEVYRYLPDFAYLKIFNAAVSVAALWILSYIIFRRQRSDFVQKFNLLKEHQNSTELILDNVEDVVWSFNLINNRFEYINHAVTKLRGYTVEEILAQPLEDALTKQSYQFITANLPMLISAYESGDESARTRREIISQPCKDGSLVDTEVIISLLKNKEGKVTKILGVTRDIGDKKKIMEKLRESEFWIAESQRVAKIGSFNYYFRTGFWEGSNTLYEIFGIDNSYERDLERWFQIIHPDEVDEMSIYYNNLVINQQTFDKEYRIVSIKDKRVKWVHGRGELITDGNGTLVKMTGTIQDITERKQAEELIVESEKKYRTIIETSMNGFFIIDLDGRIVEVNDAYCRMSGYEREELLNMNLRDLSYTNEIYEIKNHLKKIVRHGSDRFETKHMTKSGKIIAVDVSVIYNPGDRELLYCFMNDITEKNKMLHDLVIAKDEAERSNRVKSEFLAQMSHEIRSPMNVTLSFTNYIKEELGDKLPSHLVESFAAVDTATRRVIRTIDLILNMSEMQLGTYEPTWKSFDLAKEVFGNICGEYEFYAKQKGLKLIFNNNVPLPKIYGDHYSVTQIFVNLIDNAIKYSNSGEINVGIEKDKDKNINVTVQDNGIGMSDEFLKKIFEPFTQETQGYSRKFEGNGLGLALVRKYCDVNNADISVESEKGRGTKFTVTFHRLMKLNVAVD